MNKVFVPINAVNAYEFLSNHEPNKKNTDML